MARIKKRGLDYFPIDITFINNRLVRRIMKREGEGALATLISALCCIYGGEGYYALVDTYFYEDLAADLYQQTAEDVERILTLAAEYGLFDATLFKEHGVLTSAEIQEQYLFSTKRRKTSAIDSRFNLIAGEQDKNGAQEPGKGDTPVNVTFTPQNVTLTPENVTSGTHSIAQNSIAQNSIAKRSIEYPLLNSSPAGGTHDADRKSAEGRVKEDFLLPPAGCDYEQCAIIPKGNFGIIGRPTWKDFRTIHKSRRKIRHPGRRLLRLCG